MIATGLVFVFGALVATLVALLLVPLVWRQAQRLARRDFMATMPTSLNEIRAEVDRVRAEAALNVRRQEITSQAVREAHAGARAEAGRLTIANADAERRMRETSEQNGVLSEEIAALTTRLQNRDTLFVEVEGEHRTLRQDFEQRAAEHEAMADRYRELDAVADERRVRLVTSETRADGLESELRTVRRELQREREKRAAAEALLDEARGRLNHLEGADPELPILLVPGTGSDEEWSPDTPDTSPAAPTTAETNARPTSLAVGATTLEALADLRDRSRSDNPLAPDEVRARVADIAADILYTAAIAQGPGSPAAALLDAEQTSSPLAQRVRERHAAASLGGGSPSPEIIVEPAPDVAEATALNGSGVDDAAFLDGSSDQAAADTAPAVPEAVKQEAAAKRRRGGARSRQRSPR